MAITKVTSGLISADASSIDLNIDGGTLYLDVSENRVGIGNTSPTEKLHVQGTALMSSSKLSTNNGTTYWDIRRDSSTGHFVISDDGLGDVVTIKQDSGKVGIGASSPSSFLTVSGSEGSQYVGSFTNTSSQGWGLFVQAGADNDDYSFRIRNKDATDIFAIKSGGNVGIGTTSPTHKLTVGDANAETTIGVAGSRAMFGFKSDLAVMQGGAGKALQFNVGNNTFGSGEAMRIDSSGNLLVGTTTTTISSSSDGHVFYSDGQSFSVLDNSSSVNTLHVYDKVDSLYRFYVRGTGASAGTIHATNTSITGLSDERLKENIVDLETGLSEVMLLQPRRFDWKNGDGENVAGFIAQEVETVLPELVGDYKHEELDDCKSLKMGDMIPTLVKAIQEQQTIIDDLKTRIETLENA